ncbi:hypothetical protein J4G37_10350 [Microvirga sp. 3-52]|nr:hypothetical protein [Microvirga sp. 3-52]
MVSARAKFTENSGDGPGYIYIAESWKLSKKKDFLVWKYGFTHKPNVRTEFFEKKGYAGTFDWKILFKIPVPNMGSAEAEIEKIIDETDCSIADGNAYELFSPALLYQAGETFDRLSERLRREYGDRPAVNLLINALQALGPIHPQETHDRSALQIEKVRRRRYSRPISDADSEIMASEEEEVRAMTEEAKQHYEIVDPEATPVFDRGGRLVRTLDTDDAHSLLHAREEGHYPDDRNDDLHNWNVRLKP